MIKKKSKRKPPTLPKLAEKAAVILQRIVRLKACDDQGYCSCVTCGSTKPWTDMQGGHFISRRHVIHKLLEENIHPQCPYCNGFLDGNMVPYTIFMIDTYGRDFVEELQRTKLEVKKYTRQELVDLIADLNIQEREIRARKGL